MSEEWRMLLIAPKYEVSNLGRCRNARTGYIMKIHYAYDGGYPKVSLLTAMGEKPVMLARQVLLAFTPNLSDTKAVVGYNDGNNCNLSLENLVWKSQFQMRSEAWKNGSWATMKPGYTFTRADTLKGMRARRRLKRSLICLED